MLVLIQVGEMKFDPSRCEGFQAKFIQHRGHATGVECETGSSALDYFDRVLMLFLKLGHNIQGWTLPS